MKRFSALTGLLGIETRLQLQNPLAPLAMLVCGLFGFFIIQNFPVDKGVSLWGPYYLTRTLITVGFIIPCMQAYFAAKASVRDVQHQTEELMLSTPVTKSQYLLSRWGGLLLASSLLYLSFLIGVVFGLFQVAEQTIDLPVMLGSLAWASLIFILPALVLSSLVMFAIGLASRSAFVVFLVAGLSFFFYQLMSAITGSPTMAQPFVLNDTLKLLFDFFDPMATFEFYQQVAGWSLSQRNSEQISLTEGLLLNRFVVMSLVLAMAGLIFWRTQLRLVEDKPIDAKEKSKAMEKSEAAKNSEIRQVNSAKAVKTKLASPSFRSASISSLPQSSGSLLQSPGSWRLFPALVMQEFTQTVLTRLFLLIALAWSFILATEVISGLSSLESLGVTPIASTMLVLDRFMYDVLPNFGAIFLVLFSAQLVWREREANMSDLIDATPVTNGQKFMAKWLALACLPLVFTSLAILIAATLQHVFGGDIEWGLYLQLYYYNGLPLICIATLGLFVNALSPNKLIGLVLTLALVLLSQSKLGSYIGLEHGLFKFAKAPKLQYSDMVGFSATSDAFHGYMLLWSALSVVLALLSFKFMTRGRTQVQEALNLSSLRNLKICLRQPLNLALLFFVSITLMAGSHVFYRVNLEGQYQSSQERLEWRADYEKKYGHYKTLIQPKIVAVKTELALFPTERRYEMTTNYVLENKSQTAISELLIGTSLAVEVHQLEVTGARLVEHDKEFGQYRFTLDVPMPPGETRTLIISSTKSHNGYNGVTFDSFFTPDFVYYRDVRYRPQLGFVPHLQIKSESLRREFNLPPLPKEVALEQDIAKHQGDFTEHIDWATIETRVSTEAEHIAVAPGQLIAEEDLGERKLFHYKTMKPIRRIQPIISGKLEKSERLVQGTKLQVYHLPRHKPWAEEHLTAMADTLVYGNQHFSQYPASQLRLFAMPSVLNMSGYAMPQTILLDERLGFNVDRRNVQAFDHLYRRTAHEVAHQWWGHGLDGANVEGNLLLVETLAVYTQARVMAKTFGEDYVNRLIQYEHERYFFGRGHSHEVEKPSYRADENHLIYSKGSVAMNALQQKLGEDVVNRALKALMSDYVYPAKPATTLDFISTLNQASDYQHTAFNGRWLKQVVIDDWQLDSVQVEELVNGEFDVAVCVSNNGLWLDGDQYRPLSESGLAGYEVELALFSEPPASLIDKPKDERTLKRFKLNVGNSAVCTNQRVTSKPGFIALDPYFLTLDMKRENNMVKLESR